MGGKIHYSLMIQPFYVRWVLLLALLTVAVSLIGVVAAPGVGIIAGP